MDTEGRIQSQSKLCELIQAQIESYILELMVADCPSLRQAALLDPSPSAKGSR